MKMQIVAEETCPNGAVYFSQLASHHFHQSRCRDRAQYCTETPEGVCTDEFLSRKPGFLLSAMHSHAFRWFSAAPLVFLFLGLLPLQLNQIWRIFFMYGKGGGWTLFGCLQEL